MPELFIYVVSIATKGGKKPKTPTKTPNQKASCNEWQFSLLLFVVNFFVGNYFGKKLVFNYNPIYSGVKYSALLTIDLTLALKSISITGS